MAVAFSAPAMAHSAPEVISVSSSQAGSSSMLGLPARVAPRDLSASIIDVKVSPTDGQSSREFHIGEGQRVSVAIAWKDAVGVAEGDAIHYQLPKQLDIGGPLTFEIPDRALNRVIAQGVIDANNHLSITFNKEIAGQTSSGSVTVNAAVLQPDSGPVTFDLGRFGQVLIYVDPKSQEMSDLAFQRSYFSGLEESWLPDAEKTSTEKPGDDLPITDTFSEDPFKDVTGPNEGQTETPQDPEDAPLKPVGDPPEDEDDEEYLLPIFTEGKPFPLAPQKKEPQAPAEVKVEKKPTVSDLDVSGLTSLLDLLGEEDAKETRTERGVAPTVPEVRKPEGHRVQHPESHVHRDTPKQELPAAPATQRKTARGERPGHSDVSVQVNAGRDKSGKPTKEVKVVDKEPQHTAMAEPHPHPQQLADGPWVFPGEMHGMHEAEGEFMGGMLPTALAFNAIGFLAIAGGIAVLRKVK
ncbi:Ig-like domain-containing protein [Corynebacterium pseudotuberculosis]|nr:Ig-like domain-containing protein [Corynebacterium pseudotuberculosis]